MTDFSRNDLIKSLKALTQQLERGCTNHGCVINPPRGLGTNAICQCKPWNIARRLKDLSVVVARLPAHKWPE